MALYVALLDDRLILMSHRYVTLQFTLGYDTQSLVTPSCDPWGGWVWSPGKKEIVFNFFISFLWGHLWGWSHPWRGELTKNFFHYFYTRLLDLALSHVDRGSMVFETFASERRVSGFVYIPRCCVATFNNNYEWERCVGFFRFAKLPLFAPSYSFYYHPFPPSLPLSL